MLTYLRITEIAPVFSLLEASTLSLDSSCCSSIFLTSSILYKVLSVKAIKIGYKSSFALCLTLCKTSITSVCSVGRSKKLFLVLSCTSVTSSEYTSLRIVWFPLMISKFLLLSLKISKVVLVLSVSLTIIVFRVTLPFSRAPYLSGLSNNSGSYLPWWNWINPPSIIVALIVVNLLLPSLFLLFTSTLLDTFNLVGNCRYLPASIANNAKAVLAPFAIVASGDKTS